MDINKWLKEHPVSCKYGAPMGDRGEQGDPEYPYKFFLQRIRMVDWDYDPAGTYWGGGQDVEPLWGYMEQYEGDGVRGFVRAWDRADAKLAVIAEYKNARFYR